MGKLTINAAPTFKATVGIPIPGAAAERVEFTFKHRTKDQLNEFIATRGEKTDAESFMEMVAAWDFAEEFNRASVETMLQNYMGAAVATYRAYVDELTQAKAKN
jgi:hypothetical protein